MSYCICSIWWLSGRDGGAGAIAVEALLVTGASGHDRCHAGGDAAAAAHKGDRASSTPLLVPGQVPADHSKDLRETSALGDLIKS